MSIHKLTPFYYQQPDVAKVAQSLLGMVLCTRIDKQPLTSGIITETEAYCGRGDKASHANEGLCTARTETMYRAGGIGYIYLCYGIHHLFNVVTNKKDRADAVLIRALKPLDGTRTMLKRRDAEAVTPALTSGPGRLTQAMAVTTELDGIDLTGNTVWIEDRGIGLPEDQITATPRIGVDYAGADAQRPWRFYQSGSRWISSK